jgi:tRNA pseudouridine55 synthase
MDGLLVIDKPSGPTSHDVVARMRRVLRERAVGHTGTLDPMATGVLPLVLGRATRLARFMSASDKSYEAVIVLGQRTITADAEGEPIGTPFRGPLPSRERIDAALDAFRGTFLQQPPAFSAKKIKGVPSYKLARAARRAPGSHDGALGPGAESSAAMPPAVPVTAHAIEILEVANEEVTLTVHCSAGFYVRSLADDLGQRLGTGAHLAALRRTRSGEFSLHGAIPLDVAEQDPDEAASFAIPMGQLLTGLSSLVLTSDGVIRAGHGRDLGPADVEGAAEFARLVDATRAGVRFVRLLDREGGLVAIAEPGESPGLLHPSVVLK